MKRVFVKDIKEKDHVAETFLVTKKETGVSKTGKPYITLRLMDSTGGIEGRIWDDAEALSRAFQKDDVVSVKGYAVAYQGGLQININEITPVAEGGYDIRDYLPASKRVPSEMMGELTRIISGMKNRFLKALLEEIFKDSDVKRRFMEAPAAKAMHHPYLGGLLEHVLSMCRLAALISDHYSNAVNKDLLITGAVLHDIGKIYELSYFRSFDYTDEGRLIGHITMGVLLVDSKIKEIEGFPQELALLVKHMMLSHHGSLEFGSPKRPKTMEAVALYYIDDMDAKLSAIKNLIYEEGLSGAGWTSYQRIFERPLYKPGSSAFEEAPQEKKEGPIKEKSSSTIEFELFKKDLGS